MPPLLFPLLGVFLSAFAGPAAAQAQAERSQVRTPRTTFDGAALEFDFPGLQVGAAEYEEGPTGATVFYFPEGVMAAVDVRGGAPGTIATDFLTLGYESSFVDAISFAGGSSYGLAAAAGVAAEIRNLHEEESGHWAEIATVPGAIIFDLGDRRFNTITPDEALGAAALRVARPGWFPLGARGAGRFATQGKYFAEPLRSGQGGAVRQVGPTKVAVFTVVNALGYVVNREGEVVRCSNDPTVNDCGSITEHLERALAEKTQISRASTGNTTLTLVATNQKLDFWALQRLAIQVHTSMARAIQPFHTQRDGDVLFAVTTGEVENPDLEPVDLGVIAAELAWDAVLSSVPPLPAIEKAVVQVDPAIYPVYTGRYEFGPGAILTIVREGDRLWGEATGTRPIYGFAVGEKVEIFPTSETDFILRNNSADRVRFVRDNGNRVTGLMLNPGPWGLPARKMQ